MTNILYLSATEKIGGAEQVLLNLAKNLPRDKYRNFLVTQEKGALVSNFEDAGGNVFIFKMPAWRKFKNIFNRSIAVRKIANIVKKEKISLIYANTYRLAPYALSVAKATKIKHVIHLHDVITPRYAQKFLLNRSQYIITPSEYARSFIGPTKARVFVVPNAVQVALFSGTRKGVVRNEFKISADAILVGMVGNFVDKKGHKFFIEAASKVKLALGNIKFIIFGDNLYGGALTREELQALAREKGVEEDVIFAGRRTDLANILGELDIFVLPSEKESFSLALIEAMASEIPVIANKASGAPCEIIEDGHSGILLDSGDTSLLAKKIIELSLDPALRSSLAANAKKAAQERFDMPIFIGKMQEVFQEILA